MLFPQTCMSNIQAVVLTGHTSKDDQLSWLSDHGYTHELDLPVTKSMMGVVDLDNASSHYIKGFLLATSIPHPDLDSSIDHYAARQKKPSDEQFVAGMRHVLYRLNIT